MLLHLERCFKSNIAQLLGGRDLADVTDSYIAACKGNWGIEVPCHLLSSTSPRAH